MNNTKKCPFCAEEIKIDAIKCKHCHSTLNNKKHPKSFLYWLKGLFYGRLNRLNYFISRILQLIIIILLSLPLYILEIFYGESVYDTNFSSILILIIVVFLILSQLSLSVRRFHDLNWSGFFSIFSFIPLINFIILLGLLFIPGNSADNKYGSPNKKIDIKMIFNLGKTQ